MLLALKATLVVSGPALAGLWLGLRMDCALGTHPLLTLALGTLGIIGGSVGMYLLAHRSVQGISDTAKK